MVKFIAKLFIKDYQNYEDSKVRFAYGKMAGIVGIISNIILCTIKIITGIVAGSVAILADGINNLSDAGSSIVTLVGFKLASEPADKEHPFGHERIEYVTGLIVSFIIIAIGILLMENSINSIINNEEQMVFSYVTIGILAFSILMKCWQSFFYRKSGKLIDSSTLVANSVDSLNDCISTFVVLIACIISKLTGFNLDGYMGCIVSIIIVISGIKLIKQSVSPLIGEAPSKELIKYIREKVFAYEGVLGVHDMFVHSYGPGKTFVSLHAEVDSSVSINISHDIIDNIERDFLEKDNIIMVIHMDPIDTKDEETIMLRDKIKKILEDIDEVLKFHDFRVVKGPTHTNLIFDVVVPLKYKYSNTEIKNIISDKVKEYDDSLCCVIAIDEELSDV